MKSSRSLAVLFCILYSLFCLSFADVKIATYKDILESPNSDWLTYSGDYAGTRFSPLRDINRTNVALLMPRWAHHLDNVSNLRVTPLVHNGTMYVTGPYEIQALDAAKGELKWFWRMSSYGELGSNRGVAVLDDKVFIVTASCNLVAVSNIDGKILWIKKYGYSKNGNYCTLAPLVIKDKILVGVSCDKDNAKGFIAAFSAVDGKELWRFWTVPQKGQLHFETWGENIDKVGGASTWINGTYDPSLNLVYWPTGNPRPGFNGKARPGDNLYSDSILALNPDSGELKWYFQFSPHDMREWDATEYPVLANILWKGKNRDVILQANRNGFFYVIDRVSGEFLSGTPFVKRMTWAKGLDLSGRPIEVANMNFSDEGLEKGVCPGLVGATNWMSPSYNPVEKLFYVVALEHCDMESGEYFLRAIDPKSGDIRWEHPMKREGPMAAGTLATAGGLVFSGDASGNIIALDSSKGDKLWQFSIGKGIFASPMTYSVGGKQYVAIAVGSDIFVFGL